MGKQNVNKIKNDIFLVLLVINDFEFILIKISLICVPKGAVDPPLVETIAWHRTGDKPLSEPMMT